MVFPKSCSVIERHGAGVAVMLGGMLALGGCDSGMEPVSYPQVAVVLHYGEGPQVVSPDTVDAGASFEIRVATYGGGCVGQGDTEVQVVGRLVSLRPYDINSGREVCTDDLAYFTHETMVSLDGSGPIHIRVYGKELPADSIIMIERHVWAR